MSEGLEKAVKDIRKAYGEGSIVRMGQSPLVDVDVIPTGSLSLDIALGVGGIPRGRVTEIYGPEASGKTTLSQHITANAQAQGEDVVYIDMEHALDVEYAKKCGVNVDDLYIVQPATGEEALEIAEKLIRSNSVAVIIIDSVAALVPRTELEGDMGDASMGSQARLMSQALRKMSGVIRKSNTALIFTNQLRKKIGVMFGNPETTSGGEALKYYSSVRLDMRRVEGIKQGTDFVGNRVRVRVVKNKVAPPFKTAEFDIIYAEGISMHTDVLDAAVDRDIVEKRGAYYYFGSGDDEILIGHGKENARQALKEDNELFETIKERVRGDLQVPDDGEREDEVLEREEVDSELSEP